MWQLSGSVTNPDPRDGRILGRSTSQLSSPSPKAMEELECAMRAMESGLINGEIGGEILFYLPTCKVDIYIVNV